MLHIVGSLCEFKYPLTLRCLYRYYKVRVSGADSQPIQASLPARCLEKGEKLVAVTSVAGDLTALSYDLSQVCLHAISQALQSCPHMLPWVIILSVPNIICNTLGRCQ